MVYVMVCHVMLFAYAIICYGVCWMVHYVMLCYGLSVRTTSNNNDYINHNSTSSHINISSMIKHYIIHS